MPSIVARLAPLVAAHREALEQERQVPQALVEAWRAADLVRLWLPRDYAGLETAPATVLALVEAVAALDGSVAWNLLVAISTGLFAAYLPESAARAIWGPDPAVTLAAAFTPTGRAIRQSDGSYQVTGRWAFGSGAGYAAWLGGNCLLVQGDGERTGGPPGGPPAMRLLFFPASAARILDTWHTGGLRGTGSQDFVVEGVVVPGDYGFEIFQGRGRLDRPLYRLPFITWFGPGVAALTLGLARRAIDTLVSLAGTKVPTGVQAPLRERAMAQIQVAQAEALVLSARAFLHQTVQEAWAHLVAGGEPTAFEQTRLQLAKVHAGESAVRAIELMYRAAGSSAIYSTSPLDRCLRDVQVAVQHITLSNQQYPAIGQAIFAEAAAP